MRSTVTVSSLSAALTVPSQASGTSIDRGVPSPPSAPRARVFFSKNRPRSIGTDRASASRCSPMATANSKRASPRPLTRPVKRTRALPSFATCTVCCAWPSETPVALPVTVAVPAAPV